MMRDYKERFGTSQAVEAAKVSSTNNYDTRNTVDRGDDTMMVEINVTEAFVGGTSVKIDIMNAAVAARTNEVAIASLVVLIADLTLGAKFYIRMPKKTLRYVSIDYTPTGTFTAGEISSSMIAKEQTSGNTTIDEFYAIDNSGR